MTQIKVDWKPASELINPSYELYSFFADNMHGKRVAIRLKDGTIKCDVQIFSDYISPDLFENRIKWCLQNGHTHEPISFEPISFIRDSFPYQPRQITHYALLDIAPPEEQQP